MMMIMIENLDNSQSYYVKRTDISRSQESHLSVWKVGESSSSSRCVPSPATWHSTSLSMPLTCRKYLCTRAIVSSAICNKDFHWHKMYSFAKAFDYVFNKNILCRRVLGFISLFLARDVTPYMTWNLNPTLSLHNTISRYYILSVQMRLIAATEKQNRHRLVAVVISNICGTL